ncbi:MAG: hypothetical protein OFPI_05410 [Osedax symbiont Rs2]|nr:MAG: hypothetical protein OFPI_05410 [Osedax symbiont Rs2]
MLSQVIDDCEQQGYQSDLRCGQMLMRSKVNSVMDCGGVPKN